MSGLGNGVLASTALWDVSRASGTVSLLLLTASLLMGILTWSRWHTAAWPRFLTQGLHRNVSLLALALVGVHVLANVVDSFVPIRLPDAVVPFASRYRGTWVGFGALALDLLLALTVTSLLRRRLGWRAWRTAHWLAYLCWPIALVHSLGTGTDPRAAWFALGALVSAASVATVTLVRVARARSGSPPLRLALAAASVGATVTVVVWAALGPLRGGWTA